MINEFLTITTKNSQNKVLTNTSPGLYTLSLELFEGLDVSISTIKDYQYRIGRFIEYISHNGCNPSILIDYKRDLSITPFSISTRNKYLISARIFLKELYRVGYLDKDLTVNVKGFQQNHNHKKDGLSESDILLIQNYCQALDNSKSNIRLKAILSLLIFQGLRQIEICRLDIADIQLHNRLIFVHGKGQDDKEIVWLHPYTVKALGNYVKAERIQTGPLFRSKSNYCKDQQLTTKSIRVIIGDVLNDLGIDGTVHGFRHYFTTKLIKSYKGELLTVSKYTRHRSIQMLEVYNDEVVRQEDLPRFYDVFNDIKI